MRAKHRLGLVGPWYLWERQWEKGIAPKASRPEFHMYDAGDFSNDFIQDPQHRLVFKTKEDFVLNAASPEPLLRKLYLPTHKRWYVVVCELHCHLPGFPDAKHRAACETGFVVRKRPAGRPRDVASRVGGLIQKLQNKQSQRYELDRRALLPISLAGKSRVHRLEADRFLADYPVTLNKLTDEIHDLENELAQFHHGTPDQWLFRGWFAEKSKGEGYWAPVEPTPKRILEQVYPLYPLIPDPRDEDHSALGATLFYGVVPAGGSEVDQHGTPKFDEESVYEIRCFVRQHDPECPISGDREDCPGPLVWSAPTEPYRLAPHFDGIGTSYCRVTIQMPNLEDLKSQVAAIGPIRAASLQFKTPNNSSLKFPLPLGESSPSNEACSFAIPLITIVAKFAFNLFMPIVVFLFRLYYLLSLKVCFPPMSVPRINIAMGIFDFGARRDELLNGLDMAVPDPYLAEVTAAALDDLAEEARAVADKVGNNQAADGIITRRYEKRLDVRPRVDGPPFVVAGPPLVQEVVS